MPSINDLKRNNINKQPVVPESNEVVLDFTSNKNLDASIAHNEAVYNNRPKGKTIVNAPNYIKRPDGSIVNLPPRKATNTAADANRVAFDLTKMPEEKDPHEEDVHTSIADDILSGKNPILYNYMQEKAAEMAEWTQDKEDERQLKIANGEISEDEGVMIDMTQPVEIDLTSLGNNETKEEVKEESKDDLSFDQYENTAEESNESYQMQEDIFAEEDEKEIEAKIEEDIMEDNTNDTIEIVDDITDEDTTVDNEIESLIGEPVDNGVEEGNDDIKNMLKDPTVQTVFTDTKEEIEEHFADVHKKEKKSEEEVIGEVDDTPEEDKSVAADGIEFQETKPINIDPIIVEDDSTPNSTENKETPDLDDATKYIIEQATKVLKPAARKLDLSSFTVVKKPGNVNRFFQQKQISVAKWILRTKKVCIHMKASQGSELEELRVLMQEADVASDFIRMYRIIYDHITSPKPNSFEAWCKSTFVDDLDDYFFCFFLANYKNSNYLPYDCPKEGCKPGTFLSENIPVMDMVKFGSDEDKAEFKKIYQSETFDNNIEGLYPAERIPFSDQVAVEFVENTLYSYIEAQSVRNNEAFIQKYSGTIALAPNISNIYAIDQENMALIPVQYKVYENSNSNTYKSKIQKYDSVLKTLTPDEFSTLISYVNTFTSEKKKAINIKYVRPAAVCPTCGAKIEEQETSAQSLVFYRYQLGQLVNISTK